MRLMWPSRRILPVALFFGTFAWSFVYVSLPFYIQRLSTVDPVSTLRWTGWILGISALVTVATTPVWGRLAGKGNPKTFYVVVEILQVLGFVGMAMARSLIELFLARLVLGAMGAASTFAFIIAGRSPDRDVRREVSAIQSAMTVGQILGALGGAGAGARLGARRAGPHRLRAVVPPGRGDPLGVRGTGPVGGPPTTPLRGGRGGAAPDLLGGDLGGVLPRAGRVRPGVLSDGGAPPDPSPAGRGNHEHAGDRRVDHLRLGGWGCPGVARSAAVGRPPGRAEGHRLVPRLLLGPAGAPGADMGRLELRAGPVLPGALRGPRVPAGRSADRPTGGRRGYRPGQLRPDRRRVHRAGVDQ